jgi:signal transduction histidine kinase
LRLIGEQLKNFGTAEEPEEMWKLVNRLEPELRIAQQIPIHEVVQEYCIAVDVVRDWIEERKIEVPFHEYSYFYRALFELTAESIRRYSTRQAEIVTEERARYLAGLAHQMRGPLSSFPVLIDQARQAAISGAEINESVVQICDRNLKRLVSLIENVLKLERFKPDEIVVSPQRTTPSVIVANVLADNDHDAASKGLRLENAVDPSLEMETDPELLLDAMSNLIQNAVKYTSSGFVRVEGRAEGDRILFRVIDSGRGIPDEQRSTLFRTVQPGEAGGGGIGLLIVQRAVAALGGTVGLESNPGGGSVFWFRLPGLVAGKNFAA